MNTVFGSKAVLAAAGLLLAGLASPAMAGQEQAATSGPGQASASAGRLVIKTRSSPPVADPQAIGINEPGINAVAPPSGPAAAGQDQAGTESLRGIEKKDIRRGMVIARPGRMSSSAREQGSAPGAATPAPEAQQGKGIIRKSNNPF
ncbi:hypothetical protein [Sphingopyxis sp. LK2115]|uniref:hypothetical protein n=1 Tax=Sphingopyxis sp. LK2115 TaxID=2744558 RepID=UPI0016600CA8|nr:hypothetical protein [Sphingopyxis sp. LK2115]